MSRRPPHFGNHEEGGTSAEQLPVILFLHFRLYDQNTTSENIVFTLTFVSRAKPPLVCLVVTQRSETVFPFLHVGSCLDGSCCPIFKQSDGFASLVIARGTADGIPGKLVCKASEYFSHQ